MQGFKRKLTYVVGYELIGVVVSATCLAILGDSQASTTGPLAVVISTTAVIWNILYNYLFEAWEKTLADKGRSLFRRVLHAAGFQLSLVCMLVPLIAWWMGVSLWKAAGMEAVLLVFFPIYTFFYTWAFDRIFGLPDRGTAPAEDSES